MPEKLAVRASWSRARIEQAQAVGLGRDSSQSLNSGRGGQVCSTSRQGGSEATHLDAKQHVGSNPGLAVVWQRQATEDCAAGQGLEVEGEDGAGDGGDAAAPAVLAENSKACGDVSPAKQTAPLPRGTVEPTLTGGLPGVPTPWAANAPHGSRSVRECRRSQRRHPSRPRPSRIIVESGVSFANNEQTAEHDDHGTAKSMLTTLLQSRNETCDKSRHPASGVQARSGARARANRNDGAAAHAGPSEPREEASRGGEEAWRWDVGQRHGFRRASGRRTVVRLKKATGTALRQQGVPQKIQ